MNKYNKNTTFTNGDVKKKLTHTDIRAHSVIDTALSQIPTESVNQLPSIKNTYIV